MQDLTQGSVTGHLLKSTGFMLVTMVAQTLYFLIDLYWVGRLGKEAVAAVGVAGNLTFIVLAVSQMLAVGTTTLIAHASGRKDHPRALLLFNQSIVVSVIVGALFFAVAFALRGLYARAVSADAATARLAVDYLAWFVPALALQFGMIAMASALRGTGNFVPGMIVQTTTVVLNMVLAPVLIFGWGTGRPLGAPGAAVATLIAVVAGSAWLLTWFLPRTAWLRFVRADLVPQPRLWADMLRIGLPAGAEFALMAVYLFLVYALIRPFGSAAQAGFGIGMRILQAGFMPVVALGFSVAPVAGQNFGARQAQRVRDAFRMAALLATAVMLPFAVLCHVAPVPMIRVFTDDPAVIAVGDEYLRILSWNFVASGLVFVSSSMFQAIGNTLPALLASFTRLLVVAIPAVMLSRLPGFELRWIWMLTVASVTLQMGLSLLLLRRELRQRLRFDEAAVAA